MLILTYMLIVAVLAAATVAARQIRTDKSASTPVSFRRSSPANRPPMAVNAERSALARFGELGEATVELKEEPIQWLGKGETLRVNALQIVDPMTYAGSRHGNYQHFAADPSQIDRALSIISAGEAPLLPDCPWFSRITPQQRFIYLSWLASGRRVLPPDDGYLFIYCSGLVRRALIDRADYAVVFNEAMRLRRLHAARSHNAPLGSFPGFIASFLWYLAAVHSAEIQYDSVKMLASSTLTWTEETLAAALAWFAHREYPLRPWMAYIIAEHSPASQRSVVVSRVADEFRQLFAKRYEAEFGKGMLMRSSKRSRQIDFSGYANVKPFSARVANPLGLRSQFRRLSEIWNECIEELRRLSSALRDRKPGALTPAAWETLPEELRATIEHPFTEPVYQLVKRSADENGQTIVRLCDLASIAGIESRKRLTLARSRDLAMMIERTGFAMEPDARLMPQAYEWEERIAVFPQAFEGEPDTKRYGGAACMLRLGYEVAVADGEVQEEELQRVTGQIQSSFQLNEHERRRLDALRSLLRTSKSDITGLGNHLQRVMSDEGRCAVGRLLVAVAGLDGIVTSGELAALRRCYRVLGLPQDILNRTLHELVSRDDEPISILPARPGSDGEAIPPPPESEHGLRLDHAVIMRIMQETREVSALLADAMSAGGEDIDDGASSVPAAPTIVPEIATACLPASPASPSASASITQDSVAQMAGVPARYSAFYAELTSSDQLSRPAADALARRHGHMLAGAIEAINDWACEQYGNPLIYDDGDRILIERPPLREVSNA